jgi:hypothetical protein
MQEKKFQVLELLRVKNNISCLNTLTNEWVTILPKQRLVVVDNDYESDNLVILCSSSTLKNAHGYMILKNNNDAIESLGLIDKDKLKEIKPDSKMEAISKNNFSKIAKIEQLINKIYNDYDKTFYIDKFDVQGESFWDYSEVLIKNSQVSKKYGYNDTDGGYIQCYNAHDRQATLLVKDDIRIILKLDKNIGIQEENYNNDKKCYELILNKDGSSDLESIFNILSWI